MAYYSLDSDTGLEQIEKVKNNIKLPQFPVFEFLDEIEELKSEREHKLARILLKIAESKIKGTGKEAGTDELSSKEILYYIYDEIWEIENDYENFYNVDFNEDEEPEEIFRYSFYEVEEIINIDKITSFNRIEKRLLKEGYFNEDGTWGKQKEVLVYLINALDSHGFFKRRESNGRWFDMTSYSWFFESRYGIGIGYNEQFREMDNPEDEPYLPWLKEYI